MPRLAHHADVPARIIIRDNADMKFALIVLFNGLDHRGLAGESDIHDVSPLTGTEPDAVAGLHFDAPNGERARGSLVFEEAPLPFIHFFSSSAGRKPRKTPCSFMKCSCGMVSVRSRIWRARESACR